MQYHETIQPVAKPELESVRQKSSLSALLAQAILAHQQGDLAQARLLYKTVLDRDPDNVDAWHLLGVVARQQGLPHEAIEYIQKAIARNSNVASFYCNLGNALNDVGLAQEAIVAQNQAIALRPDFADAWCNLGVALKGVGQQEAAETAYKKAMALDGRHMLALSNFGSLMRDMDRAAEGVEPLLRVLSLQPSHYEALNNLALVYANLHRFDEAQGLCAKAIQYEPTRAEAYNNLAGIYKELGNIDPALNLYRQALERNPKLTETVANYGTTQMELGATLEALAIQEQYIDSVEAESVIELVARDLHFGQKLLDIVVNILIGHWLLGQLKAGFLQWIRFQPFDQTPILKEKKNSAVFWVYLQSLYRHLHENTDHYAPAAGCQFPVLHVFGESHSLAPANICLDWFGVQRVARSHFVMGTQMWHLAKSEQNYRRLVIQHQIEKLADGSSLLMTIGEIDCRPDEGLWKTHQTKGIALDFLIDRTVEGYVAWLDSVWSPSKKGTLTIQGIPAPGYILEDKIKSGDDRTRFLNMIRSVNQRLADCALKRRWFFLDVYAATATQEGRGNGVWHLDPYHLKPSFYPQASRWIRRAAET